MTGLKVQTAISVSSIVVV